MEETVYTPKDFFGLPDYLQRKILLEDLDLESINNLCEAVREEEEKSPGATKFFRDFCENAQFWKDKFRYDFPRSFAFVNSVADENGVQYEVGYWKNAYESFKITMPTSEANFRVAVEEGDLEAVRDLLEMGVDPNIRLFYGDSPAIIEASADGNLEIVEELLEAGAEVDAGDENGTPALTIAFFRRHHEVVEKLLEAGADVNAQDINGITALITVAGQGLLERTRDVLEAGANVNLRMRDGFTALILTSRYGHPEVVQMLLEAGAEIDARDDEGKTSLIWASEEGRYEVVPLLLKAGAYAYINARDEAGNTALITAIIRIRDEPDEGEDNLDNLISTIFGLIEYKPDPDIRNNNGETAIELAEELGLDSVVDALMYLKREKRAL